MNLSNLKPGQMAIVDRVINGKYGKGLVQRLEAMGIVSDRPVQVLREAKFGGPLQIRVGSTTEIAIRPQEAEMILVKTDINNQANLSEDSEFTEKTTTESIKKVKTASLVSLTAVILVAIAGFYRILITGHIHQVDEKSIAANAVSKSSSTLPKNKTAETRDAEKNLPAVAAKAETVNNKYESSEKLNKTTNYNSNNAGNTNQNTSSYVGEIINSNNQKNEANSQKIVDKNELGLLKEKLYDSLDKIWKNPVNTTSIYLVKVNKNGAIASYKPLNQVASENLRNTPLPSLVNSNGSATKEQAKTDFAEFAVLFYSNGSLEVQLE